MLSVLQTALGGMMRNQRGIEVTANNVANVNTDGYRTQRLDSATGRVEAVDDTPKPKDWPESHPYNDVDLTREMVNLKRYEIGYKANAKVAKVADSMAGELLDMFG